MFTLTAAGNDTIPSFTLVRPPFPIVFLIVGGLTEGQPYTCWWYTTSGTTSHRDSLNVQTADANGAVYFPISTKNKGDIKLFLGTAEADQYHDDKAVAMTEFTV